MSHCNNESTATMITERTQCRTCGLKNLKLIPDLGKTALLNDFLKPEDVANYKNLAATERGAVPGLFAGAR